MTQVVATTTDPMLVTMWRDLLVSAGIPAEVTGRDMGGVYGGLPNLGSMSVIVRDEDRDEARRLLDEAGRDAGRGPDHDPER